MKWQDAQPNLKDDDIVLIKEEGPPGTWPMARVLQVHPGNDELVRVATVKTQDSVLNPWVILTADNTIELHGFADASSLAYAAAIYCRQNHNGKIKVQLLVSKTKVAPVKQVYIPRLELCGAHLLSKLFNSVLRTLKHYTFDVFAWTDSKIVLSWLSSRPRKWKTFVANRISEIMEVLPTKHWRHVPS
ncbi:uncharacterized protein TNCV_342871 [Trichonephila clavipes]|nr:uncharacterized protein TNCV_342871 [Trichonephila clavipes]